VLLSPEIDFTNEAKNMDTVHANLKRASIACIIPHSIEQYVSSKVLVMNYIDGFKITNTAELDRFQIDRTALLTQVCVMYAQQIYIDGFFNGDPHFGNLMVSVSGGVVKPVLLDFGLTKRLPDRMRTAFCKMVSSRR
jgi:aarF domain-containing kinase